MHTFAVGAGQYVVHNCGETLVSKAMAAAKAAGRKAGVWVKVNIGGQDALEFGQASGRAYPRNPFQRIISKWADKFRSAGGCAETIAACRLLQAAEDNPRIRGKMVTMGLWHKNNQAPCSVCQEVLQDTANRLGSRIHVHTNAGRVFGFWPR